MILAMTLAALLAAPAPVQTIPPEARADIQAANDAWLPAMKRQDANAIVDAYDEDAVFVMPDGRSVKGRAAIADLMTQRFAAARVVDGSIEQDGLTRAGDLIYEWGHADMVVQRGATGSVHTSGRYLTVWRRGADGHWHIIRNLSLPGE
jgi:uncharacterized protein (TIGR02246 family)